MVAHLLRREIHHAGEDALGGEALEGAPAHAGGMEHRDLEAARLQRRFQAHHVAQHGLAEAGHADQRPVEVGLLHRPRRPQHRARGLADSDALQIELSP